MRRKEGRKEREGGRMERKRLVLPLKARENCFARHQLRHQSGRRKHSVKDKPFTDLYPNKLSLFLKQIATAFKESKTSVASGIDYY